MVQAQQDSVGAQADTQIKYEDPDEIGAESPAGSSSVMDPEKPAVQDTRRISQVAMNSPVQSDIASPTIASPSDQTITTLSASCTSLDSRARPPTYRSRAESSGTSAKGPSSQSQDGAVRNSLTHAQSLSIRSTNSVGTHALRVKTRGSQLSSGFDYHPALFDLKVHPDKWTNFTDEVVNATKVSASDNRKAWAAATATAMSGAIITSVVLKKSMDRWYQEKRIKEGISDMSASSLGSVLQEWNDTYFTKQGLFVHLELSESAMKHQDQKSKALRKPLFLYTKGQEREQKEDERKFVIVVTKLDADGAPTEALREMEINEQETGTPAVTAVPENVAEMPGDTHQGFLIPELPGDDVLGMAELPGGVSLGFISERAMQPPPGYAELEPDAVTRQTLDQKIPTEMDDTSREADERKPLGSQEPGQQSLHSQEAKATGRSEWSAFDKETT